MKKVYVITREVSESRKDLDFYKHFRTDIHKVFTSLKNAKEYLNMIGNGAGCYEPVITENMVIYKIGKWKYTYMLHISATE